MFKVANYQKRRAANDRRLERKHEGHIVIGRCVSLLYDLADGYQLSAAHTHQVRNGEIFLLDGRLLGLRLFLARREESRTLDL